MSIQVDERFPSESRKHEASMADMLREIAFVLHLTQRIKREMSVASAPADAACEVAVAC